MLTEKFRNLIETKMGAWRPKGGKEGFWPAKKYVFTV